MVAREASTLDEEDGVEDEDHQGAGTTSSSTRGRFVASYAPLLLIDSLLLAPMA